jgi:hypothetical protein
MTGFCDACLFFDHDDGETNGWCHRHAPRPFVVANLGVRMVTKWPRVDADDWCGDHLPLDPNAER